MCREGLDLTAKGRWLSCPGCGRVAANRIRLACWRGSPASGAAESQRAARTLAETDGDKTLGNLIVLFEEKSFAIIFVLLLGVPALPLPTGGVTHVFEIIAALLALQLIVGRDQIWLPQRWCALELAGPTQQRFIRCSST